MYKITIEKDGQKTTLRCPEDSFTATMTRDLVHDDENNVLVGSPIGHLTIKAKVIK